MMPPPCDYGKRTRRRNVLEGAEPLRMALIRRPTLRALVAGVSLALLVTPLAAARHGLPKRVDRAQDCDEYVPEKAKVMSEPGSDLALDITVLHDGLGKPEAEAIVAKAAQAYSPLNITLTPTYKKVTFDADAGSQPPAASASALLQQAKALSVGARPAGSDAVLVLTTKDLYLATEDVVGYSDCIGGIRYADRAFAVAEAFDQKVSTGGINFYVDLPAKTAAHELGHLLGARHEHANCVEGISTGDAGAREASPCTLMTNSVDVQSLNFGTLEAGIVRAHAESYAAP